MVKKPPPSPPPSPSPSDDLPDPHPDILARANNDFQLAKELQQVESDWLLWLATLFPERATHPFGLHHVKFWEHVWSIQPGQYSRPWISIWPRGGAKSTSVQLAAAALGARNVSRYALYISSTVDQANDRLGEIADMLESDVFQLFYPEHGMAQVNQYGQRKAWRRNRLHTVGGFVIDAQGLESSFRGLLVNGNRPDLCILDDIDTEKDSPDTIREHVEAITLKALPALASHAAVFAIQNLIIKDGVFGKLCDRAEEPADFLTDRIVSGPIPAIEGLEGEQRGKHWFITKGTATWEGKNIGMCQSEIIRYGISGFRRECQHAVEMPAGGMYDHIKFIQMSRDEFETTVSLDRTVVWVDPAVTRHDRSDCHAIQVDGISRDRTLYRLFTWEQRATPEKALRLAFEKALDYEAEYVGIETDQGGDTWKSVFNEARRKLIADYMNPEFYENRENFEKPLTEEQRLERVSRLASLRMKSAKAGEGHGPKVHRSSRMLSDYERGRIVHVAGTSDVLELALRRFPRFKPFDAVDAAYWSWADLMSHGRGYTSSPRNLTPSGSPRRPSSSNVRRLPIRRAVSL